MLEALAAILEDGHVFAELSERDARRVAGAVALASILQGKTGYVGADALRDRAITAQTRADGLHWDSRALAGLAMHRAAGIMEQY